MDILEEYYGKFSFTLYALVANVPGKKSWPRVVFIVIASILLSVGTAYQMIKLVIEKFKLEWMIDLVPTTVITVGTLLYIPYLHFTTDEQYKELLSIMISDLREERTEEEKAIKKQFADGARLFVKIYTMLIVVAMCGAPLSLLIPYFLDLIKPLNHTRERQFLANGEIFIDQKKYFCYIYFFQVFAVLVMCIVIGASVNMSTIIGQHLCGMGAVIGHRLENITELKDYKPLDQVEYFRLIRKKVRICIEDHQKLLRFANTIASFYDIPLTFILAGSFCTLTVSLVQVTDPQLISVKIVMFTMSQFFQLFLVSCMGQYGIDATVKIAEDAYNAKWDDCPVKMRKMLQLMILRSSKACKVTARSMYTLSIENFMSVIQTTTSFCMVLRQSQ